MTSRGTTIIEGAPSTKTITMDWRRGKSAHAIPFVGVMGEGEMAELCVGIKLPESKGAYLTGIVAPYRVISTIVAMHLIEQADTINPNETLDAALAVAKGVDYINDHHRQVLFQSGVCTTGNLEDEVRRLRADPLPADQLAQVLSQLNQLGLSLEDTVPDPHF